MVDDLDTIQVDPLFVGLTRPPTVAGIPYNAFVIEMLAVGVVFLAVGNPLYLLLAVPVHFVLYLLSAHDPSVFSCMAAWIQTNGRCFNQGYWGAVSFSPGRLRVKGSRQHG